MLQNLYSFFRLPSDTESESTDRIRIILLSIFGAMLPFDMFYSTILLFIISFSTLVDFSFKKLKLIPRSFLLFSFIIIISFSGLLYSTDSWRAHFLVERQLVFIILPILIPLAIGEINLKKVEFILCIFTFSCIYTIMFLFISALDMIYVTKLPIKYIFSYSFFNHNFSAPIGLHATYLSLYISMAIIFLAYSFKKAESILLKFIVASVTFLLSIGLLFLQSRNSILSISFIFLVIHPILNVANRKKYFTIVLIFITGLIVFGSQSTYIKKRFTSELSSDINSKRHFTSRNPEPRSWRWKCAVDIIKKKPIFGHGTGDEMPLLLNEYQTRGMKISYKEQFNTHNQYLSILIKHGIVGLFAFISCLAYFFWLAIKNRDFLYLSFLTIITLGFITENIIDANKGIFFFALFNTLLGYNALNILKQKQMAAQQSNQ